MDKHKAEYTLGRRKKPRPRVNSIVMQGNMSSVGLLVRSAGMKKNSHSILRWTSRTESLDGDMERRNVDTPVWLCSFLRG